MKKAKTIQDLKPALELLEWAARCASDTGMFSEQMDPYTGKALSATPLVWSHAEYILAVNEYCDKQRELKG